MNLRPVKFPAHHAGMRILCIRCSKWAPVAEISADLDGIPFQSYYCAGCAAVRRVERMAADIMQGPIVEVRE